MKTFKIRFTKAPSYKKVLVSVIEAKDKYQAIVLLNKQEISRGRGGRTQILEIKQVE